MKNELLLRTIIIKVLIIVLSISLMSFLLIKDKPLMSDEGAYYKLIVKVASLQFTPILLVENSSFPGYAISIGIIDHFIGASIQTSRLVTTIFSLLSVLIFYLIAKRIDPKMSEIKTLQYFFFPILFVFFFLLYTDIYSLLYTLITFLLVLKRRYFWAGFIGFLSLLIRQNNIIWLGFFCVYILLDKYIDVKVRNLTKYFKDVAIFILSFISAIVFIVINKGIVIGATNQMLRPLSFHLENIFFLLFLFFFLFLPLNIANLSKIIKLLKSNLQTFLLLILLLIDIFMIFFLTFKADSPYNSLNTCCFLRNILLNYIIDNPFNKSISFMPIGYSILSLCVTPLKNKKHYLIYPFTFIFLGLLWLIEQRYYLIPFALFILFRKSQSLLVEYSTLAIYIILSWIVFLVIINGRFFL